MANFDKNVFIIEPENSCQIDRAPYGVRLISYNAHTICDHARENSLKSPGARAIIKFVGYVQIAEIVPCQFYL